MNDPFEFLAVLVLGLVLSSVALFGLSYANTYWSCSTYTGAPTKLMAGTCYVQQANGKWVTFDSYTRAVNVELGSATPAASASR